VGRIPKSRIKICMGKKKVQPKCSKIDVNQTEHGSSEESKHSNDASMGLNEGERARTATVEEPLGYRNLTNKGWASGHKNNKG